eukprot:5053324-Pyramimonas_sp.AAC.1
MCIRDSPIYVQRALPPIRVHGEPEGKQRAPPVDSALHQLRVLHMLVALRQLDLLGPAAPILRLSGDRPAFMLKAPWSWIVLAQSLHVLECQRETILTVD